MKNKEKERERQKEICPYCKVPIGQGKCGLCRNYEFVKQEYGRISVQA